MAWGVWGKCIGGIKVEGGQEKLSVFLFVFRVFEKSVIVYQKVENTGDKKKKDKKL